MVVVTVDICALQWNRTRYGLGGCIGLGRGGSDGEGAERHGDQCGGDGDSGDVTPCLGEQNGSFLADGESLVRRLTGPIEGSVTGIEVRSFWQSTVNDRVWEQPSRLL